jgi:hypothetical protein
MCQGIDKILLELYNSFVMKDTIYLPQDIQIVEKLNRNIFLGLKHLKRYACNSNVLHWTFVSAEILGT